MSEVGTPSVSQMSYQLLRESLFSSDSSWSDVVDSKALCDTLGPLPFLHLGAIQSLCSLVSNCCITKQRVGCILLTTIAAWLLSQICIYCFQVCVKEEVQMKPKNTRSVDLQEMFPIPAAQLSLRLWLLFLAADTERLKWAISLFMAGFSASLV